MRFTTMPITLDEAKKIIDASDGEVVGASREEYFNNTGWLKDAVEAELTDDGVTIIFTLPNKEFVEYCCVKSEHMTT